MQHASRMRLRTCWRVCDDAEMRGFQMTCFYSIWDRLDEKQRLVLRTMAEMVHPDTENNISSFVPPSIHFHDLHKVLRTLRTLGLLMAVRLQPDGASSQDDAYDLHPLVRQFIRETSSREQRQGFIAPIVRYYNKRIEQFKVYLIRAPTMIILENWTRKVELEVNFGAHDRALGTLWEVRKAMLASGYYEEYIRVASRLFDELDWKDAMGRNVTQFDDTFHAFVECMVHLGRAEDADDYLDRYGAISSKNASYIGYCGLRSYAYWFRGDHKSAINWATRGHDLKVTTKADTDHSCLHNLALAERDAGMVDSALTRFLEGTTIEQVTGAALLPGKNHAYYGNVGRCLWMNADADRAMVCYKKSALLLEDDESSQAILNQGYARSWIAEALALRGELEMAYYFMRSAIFRWKRVAPPRAKEVEQKITELRDRLQPFEVFAGTSDDEIERRCGRWIRG